MLVKELNTVLKTLSGEPLTTGKGELTLKTAMFEAVLGQDPKEQHDGVEKFKRYELAKKIFNAKEEVILTSEEIALVKKNVGKFYLANAVGAVYEAIESPHISAVSTISPTANELKTAE